MYSTYVRSTYEDIISSTSSILFICMDKPINITLSISFVCIRFQKLIAWKEHLPHVILNSQAMQTLYSKAGGGMIALPMIHQIWWTQDLRVHFDSWSKVPLTIPPAPSEFSIGCHVYVFEFWREMSNMTLTWNFIGTFQFSQNHGVHYLPFSNRFWELQTKVTLGYSSKAAHFERSAFEGTEDKPQLKEVLLHTPSHDSWPWSYFGNMKGGSFASAISEFIFLFFVVVPDNWMNCSPQWSGDKMIMTLKDLMHPQTQHVTSANH